LLRIPLITPLELVRRKEAEERVRNLEKALQAARTQAYADFARAQSPRSREYILTAWEHRPGGGTITDLASRKGLHPFALARWADLLVPAKYPYLDQPNRDVFGKKGVYGWRRTADTPSAVVNTTADPVQILTFRLPPRSVAIHPGP